MQRSSARITSYLNVFPESPELQSRRVEASQHTKADARDPIPPSKKQKTMPYTPPQMTNPAWKQEMLDGKMKVWAPILARGPPFHFSRAAEKDEH